jgi:5-methylcytosine-specific restriction enzyme A
MAFILADPFRPPLHRPQGKRERDRRHDARRGSARARGYDARWERARKLYLAEHPLCRMCEHTGRIEPATVVDHKIAHRRDQALFWDQNNWQPLCVSCHSRAKQREERGRPIVVTGLDGWPV